MILDISFFDSETVGGLTSRLGSDCHQVSRVIGNDLNLILRNVLQGTGALIYLLILSLPLGLFVLGICASLLSIMLVYGVYQKKSAKLIQEFAASSNEVAQETFSLMRTIRVYGTEKLEVGRYQKWLEKLADISLRQSAAYGLWNLSFNTLYHSTQVIAVLIGGMSILAGHITAEQLTKFILYSEWLIYSTWWIGDNLSSLMQSVGASEKVFQLMDLSPSDQFTAGGMRSKLQKLTGRVEFNDVTFYYPSRTSVSVLRDFNLVLHPGEVVAIVGLSGSGKSTIVNLLLRLYEPTMGQILVDGYPLKGLNIKWLREKIGYVGQEPRLFRMDVSSNIRYGCPRSISQQDVEWAAKQAAAHEFISSLPNGYQTLVDDDLLSGGQKQRIAIARAILRDPSILILDEATSALDAESEHNVKGILRSVQSGQETKRTVIIIAHRLSTIQAADRIIVMEGGKIVEHDEVIWQVIRHKHCSFMAKIETGIFCRNPYNVTGICNRSSCPLANSRYATIRDHDGVFYLYMKTIERAHMPNKLWERVKLPRNYEKALEIIDKHLMYWPKLLVHKTKQRLTKMTQMRIRMRKLTLKTREKIMTTPRKEKKREARREEKAEKAAILEKSIEKELLERLKKGVYGDIYNYPVDKYNEILDKEVVKDTVSDYEEEEESMIEYVEGYEELEEEDMEDFGGFAFGEAEMDDDMDETLVVEGKNGRKDSAQELDREQGAKLKKKAKVLVEVEHEDTIERLRAVV
ncbi:ABC transporter B family member 26, chloroplastic-like [Dorcoceras hygrometricum]|nr:ABC transporter B family member 26, chloroplastic-like [Dorcoceras hygrometricum]